MIFSSSAHLPALSFLPSFLFFILILFSSEIKTPCSAALTCSASMLNKFTLYFLYFFRNLGDFEQFHLLAFEQPFHNLNIFSSYHEYTSEIISSISLPPAFFHWKNSACPPSIALIFFRAINIIREASSELLQAIQFPSHTLFFGF